jgi:hypothetical protein
VFIVLETNCSLSEVGIDLDHDLDDDLDEHQSSESGWNVLYNLVENLVFTRPPCEAVNIKMYKFVMSLVIFYGF